MNNKQLGTIILIVFIDILGFSLILPLVPFYTDRYGASDAVTGLLVASYAAAQLIGAPLLGRLSDRFGRRPILLVSIAGTAIGFLIFGLADPIGQALSGSLGQEGLVNTLIIGVLFFARILDGLTGGNLSVAQAYITDVTTSAERARGLGLVGVAFGLGFIVGPAAGGLLSSFGLALPSFVAAGVASLNLLLVFLLLPESTTAERRAAAVAGPRRPSLSIQALVEALRRPLVGTLLSTTFLFNLPFAMLQTVFSLYALRRFELGPTQTALILTYVGVLSVLVQGVLIAPLTKRFGEANLMIAAVGVMAGGLALWAIAPAPWFVLLALAPVAAAGGIMNVSLRSSITKAVTAQEYGGTLGLQTAFESMTRVLGPALGGWLIGTLGTGAPGLFGALLLLALWPFLGSGIHRNRERLEQVEAAVAAD